MASRILEESAGDPEALAFLGSLLVGGVADAAQTVAARRAQAIA